MDVHLEMVKNLFWWTVNGAHSKLKTGSDRPIVDDKELFVKCMQTIAITQILMIGEDLGVASPERYTRCKGYHECLDDGVLMSRKEEHELQLLKDNIQLNQEGG